MKKLVSVHLFGGKAEVCGLCGMDIHDSSGCCHDEMKVAKLVQDEVKIPVTSYEFFSAETAIISVTSLLLAPVSNTGQQKHFKNHSPPLLSAQDTYLQNNVFRI